MDIKILKNRIKKEINYVLTFLSEFLGSKESCEYLSVHVKR